MSENWRCKICLNIDAPDKLVAKEMMFGSRAQYTYFSCKHCGTVQIANPVYDGKLLYPKEYYSFNYEKSNKFKNLIKLFLYKNTVRHSLGMFSHFGKLYARFRPNLELAMIAKFLDEGISILDVGCGTGILIKALASVGYPHPIGIDPFISHSYDDLNYSVIKVDILDFQPNHLFDLIMLHHSFEHMPNPDEVLEAIYKLLSPSGKCIIRIPVSDSFAFENYKENWVQLDAPRHNFLHTTKGLSICAQRNGFQIIEIIDDSTDFQIIGSEQYKRNIALIENGTHFAPLHRQLLGKVKSPFTKHEITSYRQIAQKLRLEGYGDQKVFVLQKVV